MKIRARFLTLACALGAILCVGSAQARPAAEGYCEWQLEQCLMVAFVPEPCYMEYEQCVWGGRIAYSDAPRQVAARVAEGRSS